MTDDLFWQPTWTQAMTDFRGKDEEPPFEEISVRMAVPASIGGSHIRAELSNRFGDEPVLIGRDAITIGGRAVSITFGAEHSTQTPAGQSQWTDTVALVVNQSDDLWLDLYFPERPMRRPTGLHFNARSLATSWDRINFKRSAPSPRLTPTEWVGRSPRRSFSADHRSCSLPGARSDRMFGQFKHGNGMPQFTRALLPADARISVANRGIAGTRLRFDAPPMHRSWGRSGLSRFDEDVLGTRGVTHVVIAYNSNDLGLPGRVTSVDEMPSVSEMIESYQQLIDRAQAAGLQVILATITPLAPELLEDVGRESIRLSLNDWIRNSGRAFADFDAAIRADTEPSRLAAEYAAPDNTHPNVNGQKRLAQTMVELLERRRLFPAKRWPLI